MNSISEVATRMMNRSDIPPVKMPRNSQEFMQWQCDVYNREKGDLEGYNCPECLNRGYFQAVKDDVIVKSECRCMKIRRNILMLKNSGFSGISQRCTFESYKTPEEWQKRAKDKAMRYVAENHGRWLFFGGQSGVGKTHLCTAVCMELINREQDVKYVLWRDIVHCLEGNRFKEERYNSKIAELQNIEILYIDDFLKTARKANGRPQPSENELNTAYEIINARIISGKKTIISSELNIAEISALDEATGGRISEQSEGFQIQIKNEKNRNFRFYGGKNYD